MPIMSFKDMKEKREKLAENMKKDFVQKSFKDERLWKPSLNSKGVLSCEVRILPTVVEDRSAVVEYRLNNYSDKKKKRFYIEKCRTNIGEPDPYYEHRKKVYDGGNETLGKAMQRQIKRVCNIIILKHEDKEEIGKIYLWEMPKTIYDKIEEKINPNLNLYPDAVSVDVSDFFEGCTLNIKGVSDEFGDDKIQFINFEKSYFSEPSPIFDGDEDKMEEVYSKIHPLSEFFDPQKYLSYEDLRKKVVYVFDVKEEERADKEDAKEPKRAESSELEVDLEEDDDSIDLDSLNINDDLDDDIPF